MAGIAFGLLAAAPTIITGIEHLVQGIEGLFGHNKGPAKKSAVINALGGAITAYDGVAQVVSYPEINSTAAQDALGQVIDAVVAFYNAIGVFAHAPAPAAK